MDSKNLFYIFIILCTFRAPLHSPSIVHSSFRQRTKHVMDMAFHTTTKNTKLLVALYRTVCGEIRTYDCGLSDVPFSVFPLNVHARLPF